MEYRIEKDTMGEVKVPETAYFGAQTQRSIDNFKIAQDINKMPKEIIAAFAYLKKAAALTNTELGVLDAKKCDAIADVCDEILTGSLNDAFPLVVWQTGSGTQSNMNVNEVIAYRAHVKNGGQLTDKEKMIHPNDDVNKSQSSNDTFPTAMHIAAYKMLVDITIPGIKVLRDTLHAKATAYMQVVKIGRTHFMDATPLTLGQELSGYVSQLDHGLKAINNTLPHLAELALGGTAVGTGINTPKGYAPLVAKKIAALTGLPFVTAENKFESFEYQFPDEYRLDEQLKSICEKLSIPTKAVDSEHFYTSRYELADFFKGKMQLLMESFYRMMRKKHGILMVGEQPLDGKWNYDHNNRNQYKNEVPIPFPLEFHQKFYHM